LSLLKKLLKNMIRLFARLKTIFVMDCLTALQS